MIRDKYINNFILDYCNLVNTTKEAICSKCRKRDTVEKRMVIAHFLRKKIKMSYQHIGNILNKHHATIIHYKGLTSDMLEIYPHIKTLYNLANQAYEMNKETLYISYGEPSVLQKKERELIDILLDKNKQLQDKIINLEKELDGNKN
tara:strand:- start:106 stop:546 length:441 start_codon:yes stop_codon:yes gene_type:complete